MDSLRKVYRKFGRGFAITVQPTKKKLAAESQSGASAKDKKKELLIPVSMKKTGKFKIGKTDIKNIEEILDKS